MPTVKFADSVRVYSTEDTNAVIQGDSTTQYMLPPRMTTTQRDAITPVTEGAQIYNTTTQQTEEYNGSSWQAVGGGGAGTTFADNVFRVQDNADATKQIALEASGITTATTRTITMPDADVDLGLLVDQDGSQIYAADGGGTDAYAITLSPALTAYATGQVFHFYANTANTGAATLNVNSLGAKTIKKHHDQDLADNDIEAGQLVTVIYDGTNFQMQSQLGNAPPTLNYAHVELNEVSDLTTSSTSFGDIATSVLTLSLTTTGNPVKVGFVGSINCNSTYSVYLDITLDGTRQGGDDGIMFSDLGGADTTPYSLVYIIPSVSAAAHTIKIQWKVSNVSATATLYAGAGTSNADVHPQFWAEEM